MAEISQNVNIEMLEKLPDGTYKRKYPKTRADDGTTFDEHLADGMAHGIGNKNTLLTTNKSTLVGAMNELFTNVSNGKSLVGGAITDVDDSIVIPTDPTFQQLADAIGGISTGKKWANGVVTYSAGQNTTINLTFKPSFIFALIMGTDYFILDVDTERIQSYYYTQDVNHAPVISDIGNDSFVLGSGRWSANNGKAIEWIAYE